MVLGDSVKDTVVRREKRIGRAGFQDSRRDGDLTGKQVVSIEGDCTFITQAFFWAAHSPGEEGGCWLNLVCL